MRFMPHTEGDVAAMLETIGAKHLDDLIAHVPANLREGATINLEPGRSEYDVVHEISALAALNAKQYRVAMADSRNIVDDCTAR